MQSNPSTSRYIFIFAAVCCGALVLATRLYFISVVHGDEYRAEAERLYQRPASGIFDRGTIFYTTKEGRLESAATLSSGATLAVNPLLLPPLDAVYASITPHVKIDRATFMTRAGKKDDSYEEIVKRIGREQAALIQKMSIPGVMVLDERWRFYPGESLGSHALGFVGWKGDELRGRYGLESYYDDVLNRSDSDLKYNFFAEIFGDVKKAVKTGSSLPGDVVVSIEPTVQATLESVLVSIKKEWNPDTAGAIVMDPKTGEIFALAAIPDFDPNTYGTVTDNSVFTNPLVESVYEMGSIIKPLTMAAGIDAGVVTPISSYDDKGFLELDTKRISNYDGKARGVVSMQEVLSQSLNTGAAYVALKMGHDKFSSYMRGFGIGEETGVDLPNEVAGLVSNLDSKRDIERATASYGQGIALTPMMTIRALAALGNGGILVNPHLVKEVKYKVGYSREPDYTSTRRIISPQTSESITRMLVKVVDTALVQGDAMMPQFSIAAKTGTAQMAKEVSGGYYDDRYLHSFFGYFPAYDPRFIVFMYAVHPKGASYASQTLVTPFMDMAKFLLSYYEIAPDR